MPLETLAHGTLLTQISVEIMIPIPGLLRAAAASVVAEVEAQVPFKLSLNALKLNRHPIVQKTAVNGTHQTQETAMEPGTTMTSMPSIAVVAAVAPRTLFGNLESQKR